MTRRDIVFEALKRRALPGPAVAFLRVRLIAVDGRTAEGRELSRMIPICLSWDDDEALRRLERLARKYGWTA